MPVFAPFIRDADFAARFPWRVRQRRLLDYLLVYIQEGHCRFIIEERVYELQSGDFCLIQPNQRVDLAGLTSTLTPYAHFDLWFNARRNESFATRPGQLDLAAYAPFLQPRFDELAILPTVFQASEIENSKRDWLRIIELWSLGETLARLEAQNQLGAFFLSLARHFGAGKAAPAPPKPLGWVPSYLSTHLGEPISIADMAARARLSPSRFQTVFKSEFGVSPGRYLLEMRVNHSAELLRNSDWTLAHIANLCGFADVHHFAKAFKKQLGVAPGSYRKNR